MTQYRFLVRYSWGVGLDGKFLRFRMVLIKLGVLLLVAKWKVACVGAVVVIRIWGGVAWWCWRDCQQG
jgi:hypothetical protein